VKLIILGTRGIPAQHGGFETFAERLALYLVSKGWDVTVYCPEFEAAEEYETTWCGIRLLHLPVEREDAVGTIIFDWKSTKRSVLEKSVVLNLGYGTALFGFYYRLHGTCNIINMDGIEWRRQKWSFPAKAWLYANERLACWLANHLIADHPEIARHLATRISHDKITMIPYGADATTDADPSILASYGLVPREFVLVIARPDPDNSILEIVEGFSSRPRGVKLVVLGKYRPDKEEYHRRVMAAASAEVVFPGGVYDKRIVEALRYYCRLYVHGHQVGGTNPSLVEALAAGSPVLAHDNPYNRWVAGDAGRYFSSHSELMVHFDRLLENSSELSAMADAGRRRHAAEFTWEKVLTEYEQLLNRFHSQCS
jgi:glycosyltransferase involved in cell wall biosynthesis